MAIEIIIKGNKFEIPNEFLTKEMEMTLLAQKMLEEKESRGEGFFTEAEIELLKERVGALLRVHVENARDEK